MGSEIALRSQGSPELRRSRVGASTGVSCAVYHVCMTAQLAVRLNDEDLSALDEYAKHAGVTRSEAVRRAIRAQLEGTEAAGNRVELDRVGALLGIEAGARWRTGARLLTMTPDKDFAADIAAQVDGESTDDMTDPWES